MDDDSGYRSGTPGRDPGCIAAIAFAAVMLMPALLFAVYADCLIESACDRGGADMVAGFLLMLLVPAALFGFAVRAAVNWWAGVRAPGGERRARPPWWAFAAIILLLGAAGWLAVGEGLLWPFF